MDLRLFASFLAVVITNASVLTDRQLSRPAFWPTDREGDDLDDDIFFGEGFVPNGNPQLQGNDENDDNSLFLGQGYVPNGQPQLQGDDEDDDDPLGLSEGTDPYRMPQLEEISEIHDIVGERVDAPLALSSRPLKPSKSRSSASTKSSDSSRSRSSAFSGRHKEKDLHGQWIDPNERWKLRAQEKEEIICRFFA
jgi:hypothetical protein